MNAKRSTAGAAAAADAPAKKAPAKKAPAKKAPAKKAPAKKAPAKKAPAGRIVVVEPDVNRRGDLFTRRMADVLHVLGWEDFRFDTAKAGRELDVSGRHRAEAKSLRSECKAEARPIGGSDLNKFAGAIQVERAGDPEVVAYFMSLSGFTAPARQQEDDAGRGIALFDSDDIIRELESARVVIGGERARSLAAAAPLLPPEAKQDPAPRLLAHQHGWIWLVYSSLDHHRRYYTLMHADGSALSKGIIEDIVRDDDETYGLLAGLTAAPLRQVPTPDARSAMDRYRAFLAHEYGSITLEGMPADETVGKRSIPIESLYVPLSVYVKSEGTIASEDGPSTSNSRRRRETSETTVPASEFVVSNRQVAIVGPPGAGKSTIVKWIVTSTMSASVSGSDLQPEAENPHLPIVLRCRTLREPGRTTITEAIEAVIKQAELHDLETDFRELARAALNSGGLILLVDGLDEISSDGDRMAFAHQLRTFLGTYPSIRVVVTSRPTAFQRVAHALWETCAVGRVADLDMPGIRLLCENWEREVGGSGSPDGDVASEVVGNHRVRALAVNPLLLTTMLLVKRWLGELPRKRSVLYGKAIEVLAMTWNVEAHEPLDLDEVLPQLGFLAYDMMSTGRQVVEESELKKVLSRARTEMPEILGYATTGVGGFIASVESRSSILSLTDHAVIDGALQPIYEFKHLAFQEYLAAKAIVEGWHSGQESSSDFAETLSPYLSEPSWLEVIPLAALLSGRSASKLIQALLDRCSKVSLEDGESDVSRRALIQCLVDEVQIPPNLASSAFDAALYESSLELEGVMMSLLNGKFREIFLSAAFAAANRADGSGVNGCLAFSNKALLDAGGDPSWSTDPDGGLLFVSTNLQSTESRNRIAALTVAMDAGYLASPSTPSFGRRAKVEIDLTAVAQVGGRVRDLVEAGFFSSVGEHVAASWALAWLAPALDWDAESASSFVITQMNHWAKFDEHPDLARMAAWAIAEVPRPADFVGKLTLSKDHQRLAFDALERIGLSNPRFPQAAFLVLWYAGESLDSLAADPKIREGISEEWVGWLAEHGSAIEGPMGQVFTEALAAMEKDD